MNERNDTVPSHAKHDHRLSVYALCGTVTKNRADVPEADVRKLRDALTAWLNDPHGEIGTVFAPIPGFVA